MPLAAVVAPSILACDFGNAAADCTDVLAKGADVLHIDVMDGHFVPNIALGQPVVGSLKKALPNAFFDTHVMVSEPRRWAPEFAKAGAGRYTFHIEACADHAEAVATAQESKDAGMLVGIAVKPGTPASAVYPLVDTGLIDLVLVMTVEPGFGGQKFMAGMMDKVREVRAKYPEINIQVDGGLDAATVVPAAEAGANVIVAGTSVFKAQDRAAVIAGMHAELVKNGCTKAE